MYPVSFSDDSQTSKNGGIRVNLRPNKSFNPYTWGPPIVWRGYVGGKKVEIVQTDRTAYSNDNFDWKDFPVEFDYLKNRIRKEIDEAMRVMD